MKRDMDLIRNILLEIEKQDINSTYINNIAVDGHTPMEIMQHVKLMEDHGLIRDCTYDLSYNTYVRTITWEGYDFLEKIRDHTTWEKTKKIIVQKGLPLVLDTVKTVSTALVTAAAEGVANSIIKNGGQI